MPDNEERGYRLAANPSIWVNVCDVLQNAIKDKPGLLSDQYL